MKRQWRSTTFSTSVAVLADSRDDELDGCRVERGTGGATNPPEEEEEERRARLGAGVSRTIVTVGVVATCAAPIGCGSPPSLEVAKTIATATAATAMTDATPRPT